MRSIDQRHVLDDSETSDFNYSRIVDRRTSAVAGLWWKQGDAYAFQLEDGRARFGGYAPVMKSLKAMLRTAA
jgi:hypothetical protein